MASIRARTNISIGEYGDIPVDIVTFNGLIDEKEHIALIFKQGDKQSAPLVRLHSEQQYWTHNNTGHIWSLLLSQ